MPNIQKLEQAMPVAPIKLIATKSMETMAKNINQYLVEFRRDLNNKFKNDPAFHGYIIFFPSAALVLVQAKEKRFFRIPPEVRTYLFW